MPILQIGPTMLLITKDDLAEATTLLKTKGILDKATMLLKELWISGSRAGFRVMRKAEQIRISMARTLAPAVPDVLTVLFGFVSLVLAVYVEGSLSC